MSRIFPSLLLATLLLAPTALSAQMPPSAPANAIRMDAANLQWHRIILRHMLSSDVFQRMGWKTEILDPFAKNQSLPTQAEANLPEGVAKIFALQSNNSLVVYTTEAGYKICREITAALDIAPQRVKIKTLLAVTSHQAIDLSDPTQAILQLHKANAEFYQPTPVLTDNDTPVTGQFVPPFRVGDRFWVSPPMNGSYLVAIPVLCVTPHINSDGSITFSLDFSKVASTPNPAFPNQPTTIIHTVSNGEMAAYDVTRYFPPSDYRRLLFVTLTVLSPVPDNDYFTATP